MATSTGINPFFITHGYNTPLLNYNIATANVEDHGRVYPCRNGGKDNQETPGGLRFRPGGYRVRAGYLTTVREPAPPTRGAFKGRGPRVIKFKKRNHR